MFKKHSMISVTPSLGRGWLPQENLPGWFPWEKGRTQQCPRRHRRAAPVRRERACVWFSHSDTDESAGRKETHSLWPCRRPSPTHRRLPGRSCAPCSSHCVLSYSHHSRSLQPRGREVWRKWHNARLQPITLEFINWATENHELEVTIMFILYYTADYFHDSLINSL